MTRGIEKFSVEELEDALLKKRQAQRQSRLARLQAQGRVLDVTQVPLPGGRSGPVAPVAMDGIPQTASPAAGTRRTPPRWRWLANRALLLVELAALIGFLVLIVAMISSIRELNADAAALAAERSAVEQASVVAPTAEPVIDLVVLPGGHRPPVAGRPIVYQEVGFIPEHLLPLIDAYVPPPIPTPSVEQPRQIVIPAIDVNAPVVQGHEPEQLKKGVGQAIGSAMPGQDGNMVLSAHNDIYGEIFRHLDKLEPGDEVVVSTGRQSYTYVINQIFTVDPTAVEVMAPTDYASLTLISCYPYLVNNKRIIVKADLVDPPAGRDG